MSEANGLPAGADDERAANFAELMRMERSRNAAPVSGLAATGLISAVLAVFAGMYVNLLIGMVWGVCGLVFSVAAVPQIRHGDRRGLVLAVLGFVIAAGWGVWVTIALP